MRYRIGFIGLGKMGIPMVSNLHRQGHTLSVYRRKDVPVELHELGVRSHPSIADTIADAECIAVMLPSPDAVIDVLRSPGGVFAEAMPGALIVNFSSMGPDLARELADEAVGCGLRMIDAPVSGGVSGAESGTLSVMVGGDPSDYARALPILRAVGETVVHLGEVGSGHLVKAANQLMVAANLIGVAEGLTLMSQFDIDLEAAIGSIERGSAGSRMLSEKARMMAENSFTPGFRLAMHHQDLLTALEEASKRGLSLPVSSLAAELMGRACEGGDGDLDHSAIYKCITELSSQG